MTSARGHCFRLITRYLLGPKFRRAAGSIPELRGLADQVSAFQRVPRGTTIEPASVDGLETEWVTARGVSEETVVLYFHGGAFVSGSPATSREIAARLSAVTRARFLVPDYRLAPEHPFPAALEDATSAYCWLLNQGLDTRHLVVAGESSGGCLALQLMLTLRDEGSPLPAAAFFVSPALSLVRFDGESFSSRAAADPIVNPESCRFTASLYVGDNDQETPLLRPAEMDLGGLPPLCVHVGDCEVLLSDSEHLAERARAAGVPVELEVWPGMWHVFQGTARFVPEARRSIAAIGRFVEQQLG